MSSACTVPCIPVVDYVLPANSSVNAKTVHAYFSLTGVGSESEFLEFFDRLFDERAVIYDKPRTEWKQISLQSFKNYKNTNLVPNFALEKDSGDEIIIYLTTPTSRKRVKWIFTKEGKALSVSVVFSQELLPMEEFAQWLSVLSSPNLKTLVAYYHIYGNVDVDEKQWEEKFHSLYDQHANIQGKTPEQIKLIIREEINERKKQVKDHQKNYQLGFTVIKDANEEIVCRLKNIANPSEKEQILKFQFNKEGKVVKVENI